MGGSYYSSSQATTTRSTARAAGRSLFTHHAAIAAGTAAACTHASLDVRNPNSLGKHIRESLDSDAHPESEAFVVAFDVTGSMRNIPKVMIEKLPSLMGMLLKKGVSEHPQIMFAAIGDADGDISPLQVGQFESGNEMDDCFGNIHLEGNGQGNRFESYDLMLYYLARHTKLDCFDKRGVKGVLFLIGDERVHTTISREHVKRVIGDSIEADIDTKELLAELETRYDVFFIRPKEGSYTNDPVVTENLKSLFQENLINLDDSAAVCETIAAAIAMLRGMDEDDTKAALADSGASADHITSATTALAAFRGSRALTHRGMAATVDGDLGALATVPEEDQKGAGVLT